VNLSTNGGSSKIAISTTGKHGITEEKLSAKITAE
jgi:hypothetical protein